MTSTTTEDGKIFFAVSDPQHMEWMRDVAGIPADVPVVALARFLGLALTGHTIEPSAAQVACAPDAMCHDSEHCDRDPRKIHFDH
jgi:hypothetical protein